jgi:hypothetical protein
MLKNIKTLFTFNTSQKLNIWFAILGLSIILFSHVFGVLLSRILIENDVIIGSIKTERPRNWLMLILFAPILEEFTFRFGLSLKKFDISLSIALAFLFFYSADSFKQLSFINTNFGIGLLLSAAIFFVLKKTLSSIILNRLKSYRVSLIYLSVFLFAMAHFNLDSPVDVIIKSCPTLITGGIVFTFIRLKYSIAHSILVHISLNTLPLISFLFR